MVEDRQAHGVGHLMFALLLKWFAGGGISSIGEQINRWQEVKAKAANDHERLEADKMISFYKGQIDLTRSPRSTTSGGLLAPSWRGPLRPTS